MFVVLHIPAHTPSELARILQRVTPLPVCEANDNDPIRGGYLYVARADRHLMVEPGRIHISRGPRECRARPAADVLFRSAAIIYGQRVIGIVLTETLDDGTAGLWAVKDRGGVALVQDPASAQFASMPESARRHVEVDGVVPLDALAQEIVRHAGVAGRRPTATSAVPESMRVENIIAMEGNGLQAGVMALGKVSQYTCPDCHGVLVQIDEGPVVRFRCHPGDAFSLKTLLGEVNLAIDNALWDTLRHRGADPAVASDGQAVGGRGVIVLSVLFGALSLRKSLRDKHLRNTAFWRRCPERAIWCTWEVCSATAGPAKTLPRSAWRGARGSDHRGRDATAHSEAGARRR
jgi:two-component system chemotaxis response regulator CheB